MHTGDYPPVRRSGNAEFFRAGMAGAALDDRQLPLLRGVEDSREERRGFRKNRE
jgi:hypothetical protein